LFDFDYAIQQFVFASIIFTRLEIAFKTTDFEVVIFGGDAFAIVTTSRSSIEDLYFWSVRKVQFCIAMYAFTYSRVVGSHTVLGVTPIVCDNTDDLTVLASHYIKYQ
jgi:hypothetical protein